jgi:O-antigen/teichoic acid export membrane protein
MWQFIREFLGICPSKDEQRALLITFWRNTIGVFVALRIADFMNAITGLYIIPKHLPQQEIGALLPLMQIGAILSLPIGIFALVFTRQLCTYAVTGDAVRLRGLLRDAVTATLLTLIFSLALASFLMPWLCEMLRIEQSLAGYLSIGYSLVASFTPMLWSALQALRRFGAIAAGSLLAAPLRLIAMLFLLPLWGLSGYFVGQGFPPLVMLTVSLIVLTPLLRQSRQAPFMAWRNDLKSMARYASFVSIGFVISAIQGAIMTFVIRNRLSDEASGAYYLISRFSEIATYCGSSLATVLFPFAVEARVRGLSSKIFRAGVMYLILALGSVLTILLYWALPFLMPYDYVGYEWAAAYLTLITTLNAASGLYITDSTAHDRFTYLSFVFPLTLFLSIALYCLKLTTLVHIFHLLFITAILQFVGCLIDARLRKRHFEAKNKTTLFDV